MVDLHFPHLNVHAGMFIAALLVTIWWTHKHHVARTRHASTVMNDIKEGMIRGCVGGLVATGSPLHALVGGSVTGVVSGFVRAMHQPKVPQRVFIEDLINADLGGDE
jgi:hypothetical protein